MPKVLWLFEHVYLRVDPLKNAAGSPFGKADRLYLYLQSSGGAPTLAGTSMFIKCKFSAHT